MIGAVSSPSSAHDDLDRHVRTVLADQSLADQTLADQTLADQTRAERPTGALDDPLLTLFDAMAGSRLLDLHARRLRERGQGYYTIGSAGHEANAYVAAALRPTDPALLHYRSGAFFLTRTMQA